jgi:phosphatidylglycerophosphatase A
VATFLGTGRLRPGPGTWASLATVALWRALAPRIDPAWLLPVTISASAVAVAIGIPAATRVARQLGARDPSAVVIDEVAGQLIALIAVPVDWKTVLASLILFRAFDILKPPPVRQLERLPEGYGIVLDDIGAGVYALLVLQGARYWGLLP